MITKEKLLIYNKYYGFEDGFMRFGKPSEKAIIGDNWGLIEGLIQDIFIVKKGLASIEYSEKLEKNLVLQCESALIISELETIAAKLILKTGT